MNIPGLPTDNLYKFMAISGIFLIISSYFIVFQKADRSQVLLRELQADLAVTKDKLTDSTIKMPEKDNYERHLKLKELNYILDQKNMNMAFLVACQIIGCFLSSMGFILWYRRVQKYQDSILKEQANADTKND